MKFKLAGERPAFTWPVKVKVPLDGGKFRDDTFTAHFQSCPRSVIVEHARRDQQAVQKRIEAAQRGDSAEELAALEDYDSETAILREYFVGWNDDLVDADDNPIPFSEMVRDQLLEIHFVRRAVSEAYWAAMNGGARAKN